MGKSINLQTKKLTYFKNYFKNSKLTEIPTWARWAMNANAARYILLADSDDSITRIKLVNLIT